MDIKQSNNELQEIERELFGDGIVPPFRVTKLLARLLELRAEQKELMRD